jgi:hypothetical protein
LSTERQNLRILFNFAATMKKRSFFERLSGSAPVTDDYDAFEEDMPLPRRQAAMPAMQMAQSAAAPTQQPQTAFLH